MIGAGASSSSESSSEELSTLLGAISSAVGGGRALTAGTGAAAGFGPRGFAFLS